LENELSRRKRIEEESRAVRASLEKQLANSNAERELLLAKLEHEVKERKRIEEKFHNRLPRCKAYLVVASIIFIITVATVIISQRYHFVPKVAFKPMEIVASAVQAPVNTTLNLLEQSSLQTSKTTQVIQPVGAETSQKQVQAPPALSEKQSAVQLISPPKQNVTVVEKKEQVAINKGNNILVIRATEETWLRIKIDQNPAFQVFLKPGEIIERKGAGFKLDIGNAGGITLQFKGKLIRNLGNSGQVIHMRLPA